MLSKKQKQKLIKQDHFTNQLRKHQGKDESVFEEKSTHFSSLIWLHIRRPYY